MVFKNLMGKCRSSGFTISTCDGYNLGLGVFKGKLNLRNHRYASCLELFNNRHLIRNTWALNNKVGLFQAVPAMPTRLKFYLIMSHKPLVMGINSAIIAYENTISQLLG